LVLRKVKTLLNKVPQFFLSEKVDRNKKICNFTLISNMSKLTLVTKGTQKKLFQKNQFLRTLPFFQARNLFFMNNFFVTKVTLHF
jgi:hypothetical protein